MTVLLDLADRIGLCFVCCDRLGSPKGIAAYRLGNRQASPTVDNTLPVHRKDCLAIACRKYGSGPLPDGALSSEILGRLRRVQASRGLTVGKSSRETNKHAGASQKKPSIGTPRELKKAYGPKLPDNFHPVVAEQTRKERTRIMDEYMQEAEMRGLLKQVVGG